MDARIDVDTLLEQSRWLRSLARRLTRDDARADDLVQETLVAALEHPPRRDEGPGGLRGWLSTVLHNRARAEKRREMLRAQHEPRAARSESVDDEGPDNSLDQVRLQRALAAAILELPEPYRKAITLRWVEGRSPREVAAAQGITYEAARQRLARGAALLRERLDRDCGGRASWSALVLALPRDIVPVSASLLPKAFAVSSLAKICAAALVVIVVCLWFVLGREDGIPARPGAPLDAPPTTLAPVAHADAARNVDAAAGETTRVAQAAANPKQAVSAERLLTGIVIDPRGEPVQGARLDARHNPSAGYGGLDLAAQAGEVSMAQTKSGADGRFQLDIEPGRPFVLEVEAPPFARARLPYRYAGEDVVIRLTRGAVLVGTVLRKVDDSPVANARVRAWPRPGDVRGGSVRDSRQFDLGKTDAVGHFRAEGLPPIVLTVEVVPVEDSPPMWRKVDLSATELERLEIRVESGPTLRGVVIDASTKQPVAGALVGEGWVMKRPVHADDQGRYELKGFPLDGVYDIGVRAAGYGYRTVEVRANRDAPFPEHLDVELQKSRKARGRIVDARGQPISGAYVAGTASVYGDTQQTDWIATTSNAQGAFEISDLRPDIPHALHVRREGFGTVTYEFPAGEASAAVVELGDVTLPDMATVSGRVRRPDGEPVPDQLVMLVGWNADRLRSGAPQQTFLDSYIGERQARTDHLGRFVFADIAPGTYTVQTQSGGANEAVKRSVEVAPAARVDGPATRIENIELVLEPGLTIAGQLVGPDGEPVTDCYVSVDPVGASGARTSADVQTDVRGRFRAGGLTAGEYTLSTWHYVASDRRDEQRKYAHREFGPVVAGSENVVVVLQVEHTLHGRVLDARGEAVPGAVVVATSAREHWESTRATSDAGGRYEIALPPDLEVEVTAGPPGQDGAPDLARSMHRSGLKTGDVAVDLRLPVEIGPR